MLPLVTIVFNLVTTMLPSVLSCYHLLPEKLSRARNTHHIRTIVLVCYFFLKCGETPIVSSFDGNISIDRILDEVERF
jgi:hypothetical protein